MEKRIYIKEFILYLLLHWRNFIACMCLLAIISNGIFCVKYYNALMKTNEEVNQGEEIDLSSYENSLSKDELKNVEDNFNLYLKYNESYDKLIKYYDNSIKINLDPNSIPVVQIEYIIENCANAEDLISDLSMLLCDEKTCQEIIDKLELETEPSYIRELIEIKSTDTIKEEQGNINISSEEQKNTLTMVIQTESQHEETSEKMAEIIDEKLKLKIPELKKHYGEFNLEKIAQINTRLVDTQLLTKQNDYNNRLNNFKTLFGNIESSMTDGELNYYNALIEKYNSENDNNVLDIDEKNENIMENEQVSMRYINYKYIVLGLFLGFVLVTCYYGFPYVLNNRLQVSQEISDSFGIVVFGIVEDEHCKKHNFGRKIDRFFLSCFNKKNKEKTLEEQIMIICANIQLAMRKYEIQSAYLIGSSNSEKNMSLRHHISDVLNKIPEINIMSGKSIIDDIDSLNQLAEVEAIILVEEMGVSILSDINNEIQLCNRYSIPIIGTVLQK